MAVPVLAGSSSGSSVRHRSPATLSRAAPRVERAAGRRAEQAGRVAGDRDQPGVGRRRHVRDRWRAGPRCRASPGESGSPSCVPYSTPRPAYITSTSSAISATTPRSWVMMMTAELNSLLQVLQQVEDLRLHGHVERGGRLVGDQQLRVVDQRHRDHRALAHAAGELVRVVVDAAVRLRDADPVEHLDRLARGRRAWRRWCGARGRPRRSGCRPCRTGAAPTARPGRSSPSRCRAACASVSASAPITSVPSTPDRAGDAGALGVVQARARPCW